MKTIILILTLASANLFASTIDGHSFPIFATDSVENFSLNTTQTRTAYRQETVASTCYRSEIVGYKNVCSTSIEVRCYETRDSARVCRNEPVVRCQQVPDYRQVPYTCYRTVSVPYEVVDHQVKANFKVIINKPPKEPTSPTGANDCSLGFTMEGEALKSSANCNEFLVFSNQNKTTESYPGAVVHNYDVAINLVEAKNILAPLEGGISEMHLEDQILAFRTGDLSNNTKFSLKLFVERNHVFKGDETLINRSLAPGEYSFEKINDRFGIVKIDLNKLFGGVTGKRKHRIRVNIAVSTPDGTLLNTTSPSFSADSSITINN